MIEKKKKKLSSSLAKGERIAETSERAKMQKRQKRRKKKERKRERKKKKKKKKKWRCKLMVYQHLTVVEKLQQWL